MVRRDLDVAYDPVLSVSTFPECKQLSQVVKRVRTGDDHPISDRRPRLVQRLFKFAETEQLLHRSLISMRTYQLMRVQRLVREKLALTSRFGSERPHGSWTALLRAWISSFAVREGMS